DGIRCFHVTGVQTCALPISELRCDLGYLELLHPGKRTDTRLLIPPQLKGEFMLAHLGHGGGGEGEERHKHAGEGNSKLSHRDSRSEERRVGKECGCWWARER